MFVDYLAATLPKIQASSLFPGVLERIFDDSERVSTVGGYSGQRWGVNGPKPKACAGFGGMGRVGMGVNRGRCLYREADPEELNPQQCDCLRFPCIKGYGGAQGSGCRSWAGCGSDPEHRERPRLKVPLAH